MTALGVLCCFALFVCLTLLASFFLPSHLSFKNMYQYTLHVYTCTTHLIPTLPNRGKGNAVCMPVQVPMTIVSPVGGSGVWGAVSGGTAPDEPVSKSIYKYIDVCIHIHTYTTSNSKATKYGKGVYGVHIPVEVHVYL